MSESSPSLSFNSDLTMWPWMKLRRARSHAEQLGAETELWNLEHIAVAHAELNEDRTVVDYVLTHLPDIPVLHWSAIAGDSLACLRAALDAFAWELCHLDGAKPRNPRRIYFPIAETDEQWRRAANNLATIPGDFLERIHQFQPYKQSEVGRDLNSPAKLNNVDKHQGAIRVGLNYSTANTSGMEIGLGDPPHVDQSMKLGPLNVGDQIESGARVFRARFRKPITSASGVVQLKIEPQVAAPGSSADPVSAGLLLNRLHNAVGHVLKSVCNNPSDPA